MRKQRENMSHFEQYNRHALRDLTLNHEVTLGACGIVDRAFDALSKDLVFDSHF